MTIPTERILGAPGMFVGGITGMALIELIGHLERTVGAPQVEWDGDEQDEAGDEGPLGPLPPDILGGGKG